MSTYERGEMMTVHLHKYRFESRKAQLHNHRLLGYTGPVLGIGALHFHSYSGICSYNGHMHYFSGYTGFPIKTPNGHIHRLEGKLVCCNMHVHSFCGYTDEDVEYSSRYLKIFALNNK